MGVWSTSVLGLVGLSLSCATGEGQATQEEQSNPWSAPPLERVVTVFDGRSGERLAWSELLDELASAEAVFLGEQHNDETTHRVELAVYEGLLERRDGAVVLALEMFERDAQAVLDQYVAGEIDEPTFLESARPWSNYRTAYRPMIERARESGAPVVASNFPVALRRRIAMEGEHVIQELDGDEANWAPRELLANSARYWRWVDNAVRGHIGMMGGPKDPSDPRLMATQSLWDNSMGEACADALDDHPGSSVLHVNGGFHSSYWEGTTRQLLLRKPGLAVKTVDITPVTNPNVVELSGEPVADYVVYVARRATDLDSGRWAVSVARDLRYRIHMPESATDESPVPIMIWLGEAGLTARDGIELWRDRLGEEVAIVALETPYREISEDLGDGGRWYWPDTFSADIGVLANGVHGAWAYVARNFPVDGARVVLAGEGTGATVVASVSLLSDLPADSIAFFPRQYSKIKDFPLPLPELRGELEPVDKRLTVVAEAGDEEWWSGELAEYTGIGFENELKLALESGGIRELEAENGIREALGLAVNAGFESEEQRVLELATDSVRARHWARLAALRASERLGVPVSVVAVGQNDGEQIDLDLSAESFREERDLPRCPGDFGGTTVLVLPETVDPNDLATWMELTKKENDPLAANNRFLRLRVARMSGEYSLFNVVEKLLSENRKNVLIVPAQFCADAETMRALARTVSEFEDSMTLHWLPGLGGNL